MGFELFAMSGFGDFGGSCLGSRVVDSLIGETRIASSPKFRELGA